MSRPKYEIDHVSDNAQSRLGVHSEDVAHASGDAGVMSLAVRKDTASALAGTDGDYVPLIVDASGRLHAVIGGTATVAGDVGGYTNVVKVTPTVSASAYAAGDSVATDTELANAVQGSGDTGVVHSVVVKLEGAMAANDIEAHFFDSEPTNSTFTDNAAAVIHDDDLPKHLGFVTLNEVSDVGDTNSVLQARNIGLPVKASGSASLWVAFIARAAFTPGATTALSVSVGILQD